MTYTAIAAKSIGNSYTNLKRNHGKIVFGRLYRVIRFVPVDDVDVLTLVDVEGTDLAAFTLRKCDKVGISDLMNQVQKTVGKIKDKKDDSHKKQTGAAK